MQLLQVRFVGFGREKICHSDSSTGVGHGYVSRCQKIYFSNSRTPGLYPVIGLYPEIGQGYKDTFLTLCYLAYFLLLNVKP